MATLNELITKVSEQRDVLVLNLNEAGVTSINSETLNVLVPKVLLVKKDLTPLIVVTVETDAVVTAKNELAGKTLQETSIDGSVQFSIDDFGTWTISATKDGQTSNEVEVLVERDERDISLSFFSATVTINAETGSQVTLKNNNTFNQTISASNGKAIFTVPAAGSYTASATFDGIPSNTQQIEVVESGGNYSATLNYIKLTVNCPEGSLIVVSKDSYSYSQTADSGSYIFRLPETGIWNIEISLNEQSASGTVDCNSYTNFDISLSYYKYYGVRVALNNSNPETAVEYIDDAVGITPGWNNWKDKTIFKDIKPCVLQNGVVKYYLNKDNYTLKEEGGSSNITGIDGDVMIEFPKIGYKMTKDSNYQYIWITEDPNAEGYCYLAHSLDSENDCDKIYIGAYLYGLSGATGVLNSISGTTPTALSSSTDIIRYGEGKGTGYQCLSFYVYQLIPCLYIIINKTRNHSKRFFSNMSQGRLNQNGFCSDDNTLFNLKFLGLETAWGANVYLAGAFYSNSNDFLTDFNNFNTNGSGYRYSEQIGRVTIASGYTKEILGTNNTGFCVKEPGASASTYWTTSTYAANNFEISSSNLFGIPLFLTSNMYTRLVYKHKQS